MTFKLVNADPAFAPIAFPFLEFATRPDALSFEEIMQPLKKPRVLVFGSRNWPSPDMIGRDMGRLKTVIGEYVLVHGRAPGADSQAWEYGQYLGLEIDIFPADWDKYGNAAGPIRNNEMIASGLDYAMGYVLNDSKGSADMADRVRGARVPLKIANLHFNQDEGFPVI